MFLLITTIIIYGDIESSIKKFEKCFSRQDIKDFKNKYDKDLSDKQYELESAKVYESASKQIELKKQKFNSVSQKMINDYSKKYEEILSKDISNEEKDQLAKNLLEDTKSYDERNRQAVSKLNTEYENLTQNFAGQVQDTKTIYKQMQNLHLFDKKRYLEDMMASTNPELRDLYKERYLLNSYRLSHGETVYDGKENYLSSLLKGLFSNLKTGNSVPRLGPHFERDFQGKDASTSNDIGLNDTNKDLIKAISRFYANPVLKDTTEFEAYLIEYFKEHYKDIVGDNSHKFITDFSNTSSDSEGDLFKIARHFDIETRVFEDNFGANLVIRDGLIYEKTDKDINVIFGTDKSINEIINDLYSESLYYKHLADMNMTNSKLSSDLQDCFTQYANQNDIEIR